MLKSEGKVDLDVSASSLTLVRCFISLGKDTRLNFTGHLYEAFSRSGIRCFKDDVDLQRGEDINYLFQAIQDSLCAVLVISKNYAKSTWCLDELQKILESLNTLGQRVFPIFYNVNPADVRFQQESFGEALAELEKKFKENTTKVQNWRTALSKIGNLSGWVTRDKQEAELIKDIVEKVWTYLSSKLPSYDDNLVGIESRVCDMVTILEIGSDDKRSVGIWGLGGVGKTTLARVVYKKISYKFEVCCFIVNIRDALQKKGGLVSLQEKLLSVLKIKEMKILDQYEGKEMIRKHLSNKKVLLVLDDVDDASQLENLAASPNWFGKGSRLLITTRDRHLLTVVGVQRMYDMKTMNMDESLQFFSKKAFKEDYPKEDYLKLSKSVVKYAGGLPLALKVLGSFLCGRSKTEWIDALDRLKEIPNNDILQVLQTSYYGLNIEEKKIFLDIACFFKGWWKKEVTQILESCDLHPTIGIKVLIEKALLVETEDCKLEMHDLIEELGRYIVLQESPNDVCKRSRLWKFKDIKEVLENNKGSGEIEAIVLKSQYWIKDTIKVHPKAFSQMSRIRLFIFDSGLNCQTNGPMALKKLFRALKFVRWSYYPLEGLPFPLDGLVHIEMHQSNIKQLWNGVKSMNHLKFMDLRWSCNLTETPDFSNVQSLGHLCLSFCASLVKVHESLGVLKELVEVDLHDCENLNSLPSKLETNSLRKLDLRGCKNVKKLPEFGEGMKMLSYLDVSHTAITGLPESFGSLTGLRWLSLRATGLINLPTDCFSSLVGLVFLSLEGCEWLVSLPRLPPRLIRLEADGCHSMKHSLEEHLLTLVTSLDHECRGQTKYVISLEGGEYLPLTSIEKVQTILKHKDSKVQKYYYWPFELKDIELENLPVRNFFATMPSGGEIPSWFDPNIKYYEDKYKCEIKVDVPPNFRTSKWSGIVVCLHLYGYEGVISWSTKAPKDDEYKECAGLAHGSGILYGADGLCIMVLEFNQETCWQHLRGGNNSLHIQLSSHCFDHKILGILGYGWRVICKEDMQTWYHPNQFNQYASSEVKLSFELLSSLHGRKRGWL